jgi:trehalose-phosphatase
MRYLLEDWNVVVERLRSAKSIELFLDFDGTLAPLRARPEEAHLPEPTRRVLRRLAGRSRVRIRVISGRRQADVARRVAVPGVLCLGLYGWENGRLPGLHHDNLRMLAEAGGALAGRLHGSAGLWIEDKGVTFALHCRGAEPSALERGRAAIEGLRGELGRWLSVTAGDCVWEVMPRELRGKGDAVRLHLRHARAGALPVYIGDDDADESAFAAASHGITARVGVARRTRAGFGLRNPAEVCRVLEKLALEVP